jgi:hypothetical protein
MYLSVCLIAKDENSYLQEWLDYHILLGVEHFWIYDNESVVPLSETLAEYINKGWVTVNIIKGRSMQMFAYDHCIQTYGQYSKWIGFIDTDEFIVLHSREQLITYLKQFEPYGGMAISSLFFGEGGNKTRPRGGQICGYRTRTPDYFPRNRLVKMIVQPDKVIFPKDPHTFLFRNQDYAVNEKFQRVDTQMYPCHIDTIQLNHYFTRSEAEWKEKKARGKVASKTPYVDDRRIEVNNSALIVDTKILDTLKNLIPGIPDDPKYWEENIRRNSPFLIKCLHTAVAKITHPEFIPYEALEVTPRPEHTAYHKETQMGSSLLEEGKFTEARELFANHISRYPGEISTYTNFAAACFHQGDFQSAWPALAEAWRIAPQSLAVLIAMTDYFYAVGDYSNAEKTSLLAAIQGELTPIGIAILALSQWKQGKKQDANITVKPILSLIIKYKDQDPVFNELINLLHQ